MSIPDRVVALLEVVIFLAIYIVHKTTLIGTLARERSGELGKSLQLVAKKTREFHEMHRRIAKDQGFQSFFVRLFNKDLRKWEKEELEMMYTMKRDAATYPDPFGPPQITKPEFVSTRRFQESAPTHWACMPDSGGVGTGQERGFNVERFAGRGDERTWRSWGERGGRRIHRGTREPNGAGKWGGGRYGRGVRYACRFGAWGSKVRRRECVQSTGHLQLYIM